MESFPHSLTGEQMGLLRELVEIPSWHEPEKGIDETFIQEAIESQFSNSGCKVWRMQLGDSLELSMLGKRYFNVVAEKGSGEKVLYFIFHVDTVPPNENGEPPPKLLSDGKYLRGLGIWDMKSGVMGGIDVMRRIDPPPGMKVVAIFMVDEEGQSRGALEVIRRLRAKNGELPEPSAIFSPEIPTNAIPALRDQIMMTVGRRGHTKMTLKVELPNREGHLASNAGTDVLGLALRIHERLDKILRARFPREPHSITGLVDEFVLRTIKLNTNLYTLSTPTGAELQLSHFQSPGRFVDEITRFYRANLNHAVQQALGAMEPDAGRPQRPKTFLSQADNLTSYESYFLDIRNESLDARHRNAMKFARNVGRIIDSVNADNSMHAVESCGTSPSDACVFAEAGYPVIEAAAQGAGAHSPKEQVSPWSIARNIRVMEELAKGGAFDEP